MPSRFSGKRLGHRSRLQRSREVLSHLAKLRPISLDLSTQLISQRFGSLGPLAEAQNLALETSTYAGGNRIPNDQRAESRPNKQPDGQGSAVNHKFLLSVIELDRNR